jgi:hypothetical protein
MKSSTPSLILICLSIAIGITNLVSAEEGDLLWSRTYSINQGSEAYSLVETEDGGYLLVGSTFQESDRDVLWLKTSANGDSLWSQTFDVGHNDAALSITATSDGNYALTGLISDYQNYYMDFLLQKVDPSGDIIWTRFYGTFDDDYAYDVIETDDHGFLIVGVGNNYQHCANGGFLWMVKTDVNGDSLWCRFHEGDLWSAAHSVIETMDGGYLIAGHRVIEETWMRAWLLKTDSNGDTTWTRILGNENENEARYVIASSDGNYVVAGWSGSYWGESDAFLMKVSADGDSVWWRTFGGMEHDEAHAIIETDDGGYLLVGSSEPETDFNRELYVVKTSVDGDLMWERTYGGNDADIGYSVIQTIEGNYVISGIHYPNSGDISNVYLACLEGPPTGIAGEPQMQPMGFTFISAYPNPFNPSTTISFHLPIASEVTLHFFDTSGRKVGARFITPYPPGAHAIPFDGTNLPSGIYIYRLTAGDFQASGKLVLMK